jgi:hypothetical protein
MKKLLLLLCLVFLGTLACKNSGTKLKSLENSRFTIEEIYMIQHADSTILHPAILTDKYVIVIGDDWNSAVKIKDNSGDVHTLLLIVTILCLGLIIANIYLLIVDN